MAHREWNPKTFFKKLSPEVMEEYERERGLSLARDPERPLHDQTYFAWTALPDARRLKLESELLHVNDLCSPHARAYLEEMAAAVWVNGHSHLVEDCRNWTAHDLAMRLYLADPEQFGRCHRRYGIDTMEHFHEYRGRRPAELHATPAAKTRIKAEMTRHFRQHLGDARCGVEDYEGADKLVLFIIHEDERTPIERFDEADNIIPDWQRPVVRIACVYYPETSSLLVKAPRKLERELLRDLFAEILVGDREYFEDTSKTPKFSFDPLRNIDFTFPTRRSDKITDVTVSQVVAASAHADAGRVVINLARGRTLVAVHDALASHGIDMRTAEILGVKIQFSFEGKERSRFRTVSLVNPNGTNLHDTIRDRTIRRYLKEWKIDASPRAVAVADSSLGAP